MSLYTRRYATIVSSRDMISLQSFRKFRKFQKREVYRVFQKNVFQIFSEICLHTAKVRQILISSHKLLAAFSSITRSGALYICTSASLNGRFLVFLVIGCMSRLFLFLVLLILPEWFCYVGWGALLQDLFHSLNIWISQWLRSFFRMNFTSFLSLAKFLGKFKF